MRWLPAFLLAPALLFADTGANLARQVRQAGLDAAECYRVRELNLFHGDAKFYFTDGYLIFGKPVGGSRVSAVFSADVEGGDAELLLLPPNKSERKSLAAYTGSPNLDEHFNVAVMLFADDTYHDFLQQIGANLFNKKSEEMGVLLAEKWSSVVRNISSSFETRLVLDLLSGNRGRNAFFGAAISGNKLGNFDVLDDPRQQEQMLAGQNAERDGRTFFDVWTSFATPRRIAAPEPEFKISEYHIEAELDDDLALSCVTRIKIDLGSTPERVLAFDISRQMELLSASVDGVPAELLQRESVRESLIRDSGNELMLVVTAQPLQPGVSHELEIRHKGRVVANAGNHVYFVGSRGTWYPNRAMQFARYDLTFRYPTNLDLVAAGDIVDDKTEGDWRITRRVTRAPIRLAGFNLGNYERTRVVHGDFNIEVCANKTVEHALQPKPRDAVFNLPDAGFPRQSRRPVIPSAAPELAPNPISRLDAIADAIGGAMEFFTARFGPPPLRSLEVSPVPGRFGQGFAGMIYLATLSYLDPMAKPMAALDAHQKTFFLDLLQAHEAAHQWWGNVVFTASYHDSWLMEALANYSALLYLEKQKGAKAADSILEEYRRALLAKGPNNELMDSAGPVVQGGRLQSSLTPDAWRTITYGKGTWILHMLRRRMGDERFVPMLGELRKRFEWKPLTTEDFRLICAEFLPPKSSDAKLESFFDQWVYGTGIPSLKLTYSVKGSAPLWRVTGTVTQGGVDEDFTTETPVEIQTGKGRSITQRVRTSSEPAQFTVAVKAAPVKVLLDPGATILRR